MAERPKRPRSHQLEAESEAAFRSAIPSRWVYRGLSDDYGIDGEVELFDEEEVATGTKFLVQLKATDERELDKDFRLWMPTAKGNYYHSLDLPVLMVLFRAPSKRLYARWFHSFDAYYENVGPSGFTFIFKDKDEWSTGTPEKLESDLVEFRKITASTVPLPLRFSLRIREEAVHGVEATHLLSQLEEACKGPARKILTIHLVDAAGHGPNSIDIDEQRLEIKLARIHGFTLHTEKGYPEESAHETLFRDILVGIGLALDYLGHPVQGAELVSRFADRSFLIRSRENSIAILRCLASANQLARALELSKTLYETGETIPTAQFLQMPFLHRQERLSDAERELGCLLLSRIARKLETEGRGVSAAVTHYNVANLLRGGMRLREAVRHYRRAGELDPEYWDRIYFLKELAGTLFLSRRYSASEKLYSRALDLEPSAQLRCAHADALMFRGRYEKASEEFAHAFAESPECDLEWELKARALEYLREFVGVDEQVRDPIGALDLLPDDNEAANRGVYREALKRDALCNEAWFGLGLLARKDNPSAASKAFLLAALLSLSDYASWANASLLALQTEDLILASVILFLAVEINGDEFVRFFLSSSLTTDLEPKIKNYLYQVLSNIKTRSERQTPIVRSHRPDGGYDELVLETPIES